MTYFPEYYAHLVEKKLSWCSEEQTESLVVPVVELQSKKELKSLFLKVKEESEKVGLKISEN